MSDLGVTPQAVVAADSNSSFPDPLTPCPRDISELIFGLIIGVLIVASNIASMKVTLRHKSSKHPENKYFVVNLAVSNLLCGLALLVTNTFDMLGVLHVNSLNLSVCLKICKIWAPVHILCVMAPYVALAALGLDIAFYCHRPMDYHRRMSRVKLSSAIACSWLYPLVVVTLSAGMDPNILCDAKSWKLNISIIIYPLLLMLLPALLVIVIFVHIFRRYWITSRDLAKKMRTFRSPGSFNDTKSRLVRKFILKFLHLIVFSIVCSLLYTFLTVTEVVLEYNHNKRICVLYRLDRLFISLNSLLAPWIHSLATSQNRKRVKRKFLAWWENHFGQSKVISTKAAGRKISKTKTTIVTSQSSKDVMSPRRLLPVENQNYLAPPAPEFHLSSIQEASYNVTEE